jgi:uncharacterized DUF497 family protein
LVFEWDPAKAASNRSKHGVSFDEAATAFGDPDGLDGIDALHSADELRRFETRGVVHRPGAGPRLYDAEKRS